MRRFLAVLVLLAAPATALACGMPHYQEKRLAEVMKQIDAAEAAPVAPVVVDTAPAPVVAQPEPAPTVIPEASVPAKPKS